MVTPSGGNRLKGQVFGFFSSDAMQTGARPVTGYYQTGFTFSDVGGSLSGPIVRDRLWFFAAYNANYEQRENTYGFGTLADTRRQHVFAGKLTWQPALVRRPLSPFWEIRAGVNGSPMVRWCSLPAFP